MKPTALLQEIRKMRFVEAYDGWNMGRLAHGQRRGYWVFASAVSGATWCAMKRKAWTG